jgi:hypothetical protein
LRINAGAQIDSSCGKNIRGPASISAQIDTDDTALGTALLGKIHDLKEAIFRTVIVSGEDVMILLLNPPAKTKPAFRRKKATNHRRRCILIVICPNAPRAN